MLYITRRIHIENNLHLVIAFSLEICYTDDIYVKGNFIMQYKKKLLVLLLLGYGLLMVVLIGMLTISMILNSNVLYMNGALVQVIDIAITIVDIFAFGISAAVMIYGIYLYGAKALSTLYAAYLCITVFHYVALVCINWALFPNNLPKSIQDLGTCLFEDILLFVALDCLRIFLICLITAGSMKKVEAKKAILNRTNALLGSEILDERTGYFPMSSFISFKNPVQIGIFTTAVIYWLTFYLQHVYITVLSVLKFDYVEGIPMQIIYLLLDAVLACICYCIMMYIMLKLDEKLPKTQDI